MRVSESCCLRSFSKGYPMHFIIIWRKMLSNQQIFNILWAFIYYSYSAYWIRRKFSPKWNEEIDKNLTFSFKWILLAELHSNKWPEYVNNLWAGQHSTSVLIITIIPLLLPSFYSRVSSLSISDCLVFRNIDCNALRLI